MSARVFNPLVLSEMRRMIGRSNSDASPAAVARVRRDLFGPVNHEDAQSFVDKEFAAIRKRDSEKWGFDFVKEMPLDNSRYRWERVTPDENIPEAYALRGLSFISQHVTEKSSERTTRDASTNTTTTSSTSQEQTTQTARPTVRQSQITDYMKCRKRSLSVGDTSVRKDGYARVGDFSSAKVGTPASLSEPSKRKRTRTRQ